MKYGITEKFHVLKSLVYFEDAENEPIPIIIEKISWNEIKHFFGNLVKKF